MGKTSPAPQPQEQRVTQTNLPDYAEPYFRNIMERAQAESYRKYQPYETDRIADFTPAQEQIQKNVLAMQGPAQFGTGSALAYQAGLGALNQKYDAGQFSGGYNPTQFQTGFTPGQFSVQGLGNLGNVRDATAERIQADKMNAAQTQFQANLERFQMAAPDRFNQAQAEQYMSPYIRNVLDTQKREAIRDARQGQIVQDLGAARQGTYGGSRQLLAGLERERNLGQQLGDIEARGLQSAFESSQAQFERDRAAQMAAQQANLQAALGVQELGTTTGLQVALANLSNEQQARVQNMAAENQARGMNAENALRAALANQQADIGVRGQNLQGAMQTQQLGLEAQRLGEQSRQFGAQQGLEAQRLGDMSRQFGSQQGLEAQRLREQSRQFGAQQGLAGLQAAGQMGQTLGNLGQLQQQTDLQRLQAQAGAAGEQQAMQQRFLDQEYADFLRRRDYEMEKLGQYGNLLRGVPVGLSTTNTTYATPPSFASQALGAGLAGLGAYNTFRGG
jgi:hypothetical protein